MLRLPLLRGVVACGRGLLLRARLLLYALLRLLLLRRQHLHLLELPGRTAESRGVGERLGNDHLRQALRRALRPALHGVRVGGGGRGVARVAAQVEEGGVDVVVVERRQGKCAPGVQEQVGRRGGMLDVDEGGPVGGGLARLVAVPVQIAVHVAAHVAVHVAAHVVGGMARTRVGVRGGRPDALVGTGREQGLSVLILGEVVQQRHQQLVRDVVVEARALQLVAHVVERHRRGDVPNVRLEGCHRARSSSGWRAATAVATATAAACAWEFKFRESNKPFY